MDPQRPPGPPDRFGAPQPDIGPDQLAKAAYSEAQGQGQDGTAAASNAWKRGMVDLGRRLDTGQVNPGEENLAKIYGHLVQTKQMKPAVAAAVAHEYLYRQAQQQQAGAGPPGGTPPGMAGAASPPPPPGMPPPMPGR